MNYDEMSDAEINIAIDRLLVSEAQAHWIGIKDYCNNPSDAWPIIDSIWWELLLADEYGVTEWARHMRSNDDKLRAAMICFLKLKESEK